MGSDYPGVDSAPLYCAEAIRGDVAHTRRGVERCRRWRLVHGEAWMCNNKEAQRKLCYVYDVLPQKFALGKRGSADL